MNIIDHDALPSKATSIASIKLCAALRIQAAAHNPTNSREVSWLMGLSDIPDVSDVNTRLAVRSLRQVTKL